MDTKVRVDKWLWAVRVYKTRSEATESCRKGHVAIGNLQVKPSREIHVGEVIKVRKNPITRSFKVLAMTEKRLSSKLVPEYMKDITPPEELKILEMQKDMVWISREKGTGRPTKKERRNLDDVFNF
jgi:ribosome-associated heat shock protein Hsp15